MAMRETHLAVTAQHFHAETGAAQECGNCSAAIQFHNMRFCAAAIKISGFAKSYDMPG